MAVASSYFDTSAPTDDDMTFKQRIAQVMSPNSAQSLVGEPPDSPPATAAGQTTPLTGSLAGPPKQAVPKNLDKPESLASYNTPQNTGISRPPDGGNVRSIVNPVQAQPAQPMQLAQPARTAQVTASPLQPAAQTAQTIRPAQAPGSVQPAQPSALDTAQSKLAQLTNSGPGWSQIKNPVGRVAAGIGNAALQFLSPQTAANTPGTTSHNQQLIARQIGVVGNLQGQQTAAAQQQDIQQQAAQRAAKAQQDLADAQRDALRNPTAKEADLYNLDPDGQYRPQELGRLAIEANKSAKPDSVNGMYASAVQDAIQRGVDPGKDPKVQQLADSITSIQKPAATKAEQRDDRAIAILSKPPGQRTPGENAYMTGYNQWVKETKVDPGTSRMSVLLQQPIAVADPNHPGGEIFATKKNAIGMGAPGGVDTTAPKAVAKDFTSGPDAKTLNNINTAAAHLKLLRSTVTALNNGDYQALNRWGQEWSKQTGNPAPTNFNMVRDALAGEVSKTFTGAAATIPEIDRLTHDINNAQSGPVLNGVLDQADALMASKRQNLKGQYDQGMKGQANFGGPSNTPPKRDPNMLYARDPGGKLHASPKEGAKPLPAGWKYDVQPAGGK